MQQSAESHKLLDYSAIIISVLAATFTAWQGYEAHMARIDARESARIARQDAQEAAKTAREDFETQVKTLVDSGNASALQAKRSADAAMESAQTAKVTSRLHLDPRLRLMSFLNPAEKIAPQLRIKNVSPVDALDLRVRVAGIRAHPNRQGYQFASLTTSMVDWNIPKLSPSEERVISVDMREVDSLNPTFGAEDPRLRIIDISITFRRDPDRKPYEAHAFLFTAQDGTLIEENNSAVTAEPYIGLKKAILKTMGKIQFPEVGNELHYVQ